MILDKLLIMLNKHQKIISIVLLTIFLIIGLKLQIDLTKDLKALPSPLYGGDDYYQLGSINHLRQGGKFLESSAMKGELPGYLPLYGYLCAKFANIFNIDSIKAMLYFSIIIFFAATIIWFILFQKIFNNYLISTIGVFIANNFTNYPILKYTPFTQKIMIPLFLLALFFDFKKKTYLTKIFLAITYGLLTYSHMVSFIGATIILTVFAAVELISQIKNKDIKTLKKYLLKWLIFAIIALIIIMGYWHKPLFEYHLKPKYDRIHMDIWDFSRFGVQISFLWSVLKSTFLNLKSIKGIILSMLSIIGVVLLFQIKQNKNKKFLSILLIGTIIAVFSYFITEPLIKMNFIPNYMSSFFIPVVFALISIFALKILMNSNTKKKLNTIILLVLFVLFLVPSMVAFEKHIENSKWIQTGKKPLPKNIVSVTDYLKENTNISDVILSTKELSFALNALSGRKNLVSRWAQQNNQYVNLPQRDIDASIILYGNNTKEKIKLVEKYGIKYLYWDVSWIATEFVVNKKGELVNYFDPLITYSTEKAKQELKENNISFKELTTWVDPSSKNEKIRKFKILLISPDNYHVPTHPWKPDLDDYLEEVWNYTQGKQKIAALFRIKKNE